MRSHMLNQTDVHGHRRKETFACNEEFASATWPDLCDHKGRDDCGNDAEFDFSETELDGLDCNSNVACGDKSRAPTQCGAMHPRDHRLRTFCNGRKHSSDGASVL